MRYKRIGYNINAMQQSLCLVINPITVDSFASLFNCTPVGRAPDSMMGPNIKLVDLFKLVGYGLSLVCCLVIRGSTGGFAFAPVFQWYCFIPRGSPGVTIRSV